MRWANGMVSGALAGAAVWLLARAALAPQAAALALAFPMSIAVLGIALATRPDATHQDRIGFAATVSFLVAVLLWIALGPLHALARPLPVAAAAAVALFPGVAIVVLLARRLLDFDARELGLRPGGERRAGELSRAGLLAGVAALLAFAYLDVRVGPSAWGPITGTPLVRVLAEEILFRGFVFAAFRERLGARVAVPLQALLYAFATARGPEDAGVAFGVRLGLGVAACAPAHAGWTVFFAVVVRIGLDRAFR